MIGAGTYEYDSQKVDEFMWKGDTKATPVQRVGLFIFAVLFLFLFVVFVALAVLDREWLIKPIGLIMATLSGIFGFRFLFNAFRHQKHHKLDR